MKKLSAYIYPQTILQKGRFSTDTTRLPQSITRYSLLFYYLYSCIRQLAIPWHYFQLNSRYFNSKKGIFSKLDIDTLIPEKLRLRQYPYDIDIRPERYPVFLKPEWGQNSNGIVCAHNEAEYVSFTAMADTRSMQYIVQEAAPGVKEFEIYYLRSPENFAEHAFLSVTRVFNRSGNRYPVNSIHNSYTGYRDITEYFSDTDLQKIWRLIRGIGIFRMARVGVKADSREALVRGEFKIIEINLFLPMPLVLLCDNVQRLEKFKIIKKTMTIAAQLVNTLGREETKQWIFFRKMRAHYKTVS